MDPAVRREFDEIRAVIAAWGAEGQCMERRFEALHRQAMVRMDKAEQRTDKAEQRMDKAEQRMDRMDHQLQVTAKLVAAGIKMINKLSAETRELKRAQKAFLDSLRRGNGNGYKPSR